MSGTPSTDFAVPASENKTPPSAPVKKYESGSGQYKINVRIFKEQREESFVQGSQEDAQIKSVESNTGS